MSPKALASGEHVRAEPGVRRRRSSFKDRVAGDHITLVEVAVLLRQGEGAPRLDRLQDHDRPELAHRSAARAATSRSRTASSRPTCRRSRRTRALSVAQGGRRSATRASRSTSATRRASASAYSNVGTPIAKSQYLRTAFELALDRTTINKVVFGGLEPARLLPDRARQPVVQADDRGPPRATCTPTSARRRQLVKASGIAEPDGPPDARRHRPGRTRGSAR